MQLPVFKAVLNRSDAEQWLAWIWFLEDPRSVYRDLPESDRETSVNEALFSGPVKVPKEVTAARKTYRESNQTAATMLLGTTIESVHKLRDWLKNVDPASEDYDVAKHLKVLSDLGKVVNSLSELEKSIAKQLSPNDTYGGVELNEFNE